MIGSIGTSLTGLESATKKLQASASNIANLQTVGSIEEGGQAPYTPITTVQTTITDGQGNGLGVATNYAPKGEPYYSLYSPDSPFANAEGIIGVPNVDLAEEAVNMQIAKATYKANVAAIKVAEDMSDELLSIFDKKA